MDVLMRFDDLGLEFNRPDMEQVTLPPDITILSSEQLAEKFTALTAWADYIATQHAMSVIEERAAQKLLDFTENKMLVSRFGAVKGERITFVKAQISVDDKIVELSQDYEVKYARRKMLEVFLNNHERDLTLVSREITRRTNDQRAFRKDYGV